MPGHGKRQRLPKTDDAEVCNNIEKVSEKKIETYKSTVNYYKISVKNLDVRDLPNILKSLMILFQSILDIITADIPSNDTIRVTMDNPELDFQIVLPFMRRSSLAVEGILTEIERVL